VKNVPGRPKTDKIDAIWLAKLAERGMLRPSLVHPKPIRQLRDLTRYRRSLIRDRSRERQRVEKLLEDAQIKLGTVLRDPFGKSGRAIMDALVAGQRNPKVLASLAQGRARAKTAQLAEAMTGLFTEHHARILALMLDNNDRLTAQIAVLDVAIEQAVAPFSGQLAQLVEIYGIAKVAAQELIAEIGVDMSRFPSAAHLVSWAKFCPQTHESAGKRRNKGRAKGNPWLAATLGNVVAVLASSDTFLGARYRRLARRLGKQKAIIAVGNSLLTHIWYLLSNPQNRYVDLGADYYQAKINKERRARDLARALQAVTGQTILVRDGRISIADSAA
jgi:transposase